MVDNQAGGIKKFDPNGDAILVASHPTKPTMKWLVSSAILGMVSPYFRAIFSTKFREGITVSKGECPEIELKEDDPEALDLILSIFHHQPDLKHQTLPAKSLAIVALHCDKYQCSTIPTMYPWITIWFQNAPQPTEISDYAHLLAAACLLKLPDHINRLSIEIIREVNLGIENLCTLDESTAMIPQVLQDQIATSIAELVEKILVQFQMTERRLQGYSELYLNNNSKYCHNCRNFLEEAGAEISRSCERCSRQSLLQVPCTRYSRVGEYYAYLRELNVWPTVKSLKQRSVADIVDCVINGKHIRHSCTGNHLCPLKVEVGDLRRTLQHIKATIPGVSYDFSQGQ